MTFELQDVVALDLNLDACALRYGAGACTAGTEVATGTSQAGGSKNTIKLAAGASASDDFYNGYAVTLADGRRAIITDYVGATKIATIDRNWRVNLITRSREIDHADWSSVGTGSVTVNTDRAPDGTLTADTLTDSDATQRFQKYQTITIADDTVSRRIVMYAKAGTESVLHVRTNMTGGTAVDVSTYFDLSTGDTLFTPGHDLWSIKYIADGWFKVTATVANNGLGNTSMQVRFGMGAATSDTGTIIIGGVWCNEVEDPDEEIITTSAAINLPDSIAYRILEVGGECYNCINTCQDPANFSKATKARKFCNAGAPVPAGNQIRPYIMPGGISTAATELDLEKGLAPRSDVKVTLADEPASDIGEDLYYATRATAAQGSFWTRLLARNKNYAGRWATLKTAYFTAGWDDLAFVDERYVIERIDGPDRNDQITVTLKDPIKLTDRATVPETSKGVLLSAITDISASVPLLTGQGADYPSSGYVRINDEIIQYTTNSSDVLGGLTRAQFNTVAAAADAGDGVQICKVYSAAQPWEVLEDLLLSSNLDAANINSTGFQSEDDAWLGSGWEITACLSEPMKASDHLKDLLPQIGGFMWWNPTSQQVDFNVLAPLNPEETVAASLTDTNAIIKNTVNITVLEDLRRTRHQIWYGMVSPVEDDGEAKNFSRLRLHVDADAESANEYNDVRAEVVYSKWFDDNDAAMGTLASRRIGYYRDAPRNIEIKVDAKDADIREGDYVDVDTYGFTDETGAAETARCIVLRRRDERGKISLKLRVLNFGFRYAFIAPDGTGDYPTDPQWAHINPDSEVFPDGTPGYQAF